MKTLSGKTLAAIYSVVFILATMTLLLSFIAAPEFSLSGLSGPSPNFRWRKELIQFFTTLRWKAGDRLFNSSVIGSDGWILYTGELSIQDYQHTNLPDRKDLRLIQTELDQLDAYLRQEGKTLLVVIPPNKNTIYGQFMPSEIPVLDRKSRLDEFDAFMEQHGKAQILDLRPVLLKASQSGPVYYKTDTHWNDTGAYYAYVEIMKTLSADYPILQPHPLSDFDMKYVSETRDLPAMMGLLQLTEGSWQLRPRSPVNRQTARLPLSNGLSVRFTTNPNSELPRLLVFHDSFYDFGLGTFMESSFSHVTTVPYTDDPAIWSTDWIQMQPSDIVIIELTERYLDGLSSLLREFQK